MIAFFLVEIGDKTQLAALSFSASGNSRWTVFLATALALTLAAGIAVAAGELLSRSIPPIWLRRAAGLLFLLLGVFFLAVRNDA